MKYINGLISLEKRIHSYKDQTFLDNLMKEKVFLLKEVPEQKELILNHYNDVYRYISTSGLGENIVYAILKFEMSLNSLRSKVVFNDLTAYLQRFEPYPSEQKTILLDFLKVYRDSNLYPNGKKFFILQRNYFRAVFITLEATGYQIPPKWKECIDKDIDLLKVHGFNTSKKVFSEEHIESYKKDKGSESYTEVVKRINKEKYIKQKKLPTVTIQNDTTEVLKPKVNTDEEILD